MKNLPKGWTACEVSSVAEINPRKPKAAPDELVSFVGMADVSEDMRLVHHSPRPYAAVANGFTGFEDNDILVAKITPCFENGKGALVTDLTNGKGFGSTEFHVVRAQDESTRQLLFHHFSTHEFRVRGEANMTGSAGQKRIPSSFISEYVVPLPPKAEREKIAAILGACDRALEGTALLLEKQEKRKKAMTNDLLHLNSLSVPQGWAMHEVGDFVSALQSGVSVNSTEDEKLGSTKRILKTSAVFNGEFYPEKNKIITKADEKRAKLHPRANAIIISRMNTVELVGQSGYVSESSTEVYLPDRLWQTVFHDENALSVKWLSYYLSSDRVRSSIRNAASGTSGSMKNIAQEAFLKIPVLAPPVAKQHTIAHILETVDKELKLLRKQHALLQLQKKGLMQHLLTGQSLTY